MPGTWRARVGRWSHPGGVLRRPTCALRPGRTDPREPDAVHRRQAPAAARNRGGSPMKKAFPIILMLVGVVFLGAGVYTIGRGFDAKDQVKSELEAQNIVTPEDASIPNTQVN